MWRVVIEVEQEREFRDRAPRPHLRRRAAGILEVASGRSAAVRDGLLRERYPDTVGAWLAQFQCGCTDLLRGVGLLHTGGPRVSRQD